MVLATSGPWWAPALVPPPSLPLPWPASLPPDWVRPKKDSSCVRVGAWWSFSGINHGFLSMSRVEPSNPRFLPAQVAPFLTAPALSPSVRGAGAFGLPAADHTCIHGCEHGPESTRNMDGQEERMNTNSRDYRLQPSRDNADNAHHMPGTRLTMSSLFGEDRTEEAAAVLVCRKHPDALCQFVAGTGYCRREHGRRGWRGTPFILIRWDILELHKQSIRWVGACACILGRGHTPVSPSWTEPTSKRVGGRGQHDALPRAASESDSGRHHSFVFDRVERAGRAADECVGVGVGVCE